MRRNDKLRDEIIGELRKQRPDYELYKIMDDLQFTEDALIPALAMINHMKKIYPYTEEVKINQFVALVDIDGD